LFIDYVIRVLCWVCAIFNPQYITFAGPDFRESCLPKISKKLANIVPERMIAEIYYSSDDNKDYFDGVAHLAAGKMFDEVQLLKA